MSIENGNTGVSVADIPIPRLPESQISPHEVLVQKGVGNPLMLPDDMPRFVRQVGRLVRKGYGERALSNHYTRRLFINAIYDNSLRGLSLSEQETLDTREREATEEDTRAWVRALEGVFPYRKRPFGVFDRAWEHYQDVKDTIEKLERARSN